MELEHGEVALGRNVRSDSCTVTGSATPHKRRAGCAACARALAECTASESLTAAVDRGEGREDRSPRPRPVDTCTYITVRFNRTANRTVIECLTFFSVRIAIREHAILGPFCVWPSHLSDTFLGGWMDGWMDGLSDSPSIVVFSRVRNGHCSALAFLTVTPALRAGLYIHIIML